MNRLTRLAVLTLVTTVATCCTAPMAWAVEDPEPVLPSPPPPETHAALSEHLAWMVTGGAIALVLVMLGVLLHLLLPAVELRRTRPRLRRRPGAEQAAP